MVDTIGEVNIGVNYVADDKSIKKATDKLLKARSGLHESLVSDLQNVLYSRYMKTGKASTGLRAGILFKKEFELELSKYQESLLQSAGGLAMERKGFVSRAEKSYLKQQERLEKQRIAQEEKNRKQQEVNENRKIKEQERLEKQKENEENYLRKQIASKSNMFEWLDFDYTEAKKKRMGSSDFAKMQLKTKQSLHSVEELLKQIEKTDLKDTKEVQNLRKNFDKYSKISLKSQKELGIKTPSMLSQLKPLLSKLGLGWLGGPSAILGALGFYTLKKGQDVEKGIQQTVKDYSAYDLNELDLGTARSFAKIYGLEEQEGVNVAKYVADFRYRAGRGLLSKEETQVLSLLPSFTTSLRAGENLESSLDNLVSDIRNAYKDPRKFGYLRNYMAGTPLSPNLLATKEEFVSDEQKNYLKNIYKEQEQYRIGQRFTQRQKEIDRATFEYGMESSFGRLGYNINTLYNRIKATAIKPSNNILSEKVNRREVLNPITNNEFDNSQNSSSEKNVNVDTININIKADNFEGKNLGEKVKMEMPDVLKTMFMSK